MSTRYHTLRQHLFLADALVDAPLPVSLLRRLELARGLLALGDVGLGAGQCRRALFDGRLERALSQLGVEALLALPVGVVHGAAGLELLAENLVALEPLGHGLGRLVQVHFVALVELRVGPLAGSRRGPGRVRVDLGLVWHERRAHGMWRETWTRSQSSLVRRCCSARSRCSFSSLALASCWARASSEAC